MKHIRFISFLMALVLVFSAVSCASTKAAEPAESAAPAVFVPNDNDIVVLFSNDVHCGIEGTIGYAGLVSYRDSLKAATPYIVTADCGDAVQGEVIGTVSKGEYIVNIMNKCGYDVAVLGNHEFDYGMDQLANLVAKADYTYLAANLNFSGKNETFLGDTKPYIIKEFGNKKVAFIGLETPDSITTSTPSYFQEDGVYVYTFDTCRDGSLLATVQGYVDEVRTAGADYVILMTHLGDEAVASGSTSLAVIAGTEGVDAVLDGHAHSVIPCQKVANKNGEDVVLCSTGTKFENLGKLTIAADGTISAELISDWEGKDEATAAYIAEIQASYEEAMKRVVATIDAGFSISRADGSRAVRNSETAIGNMCADAYRTLAGTDIAFVNGGGIRADLPKGDVTYEDIIKVHPFGNQLTAVKTTGQQILDCLELACINTQKEGSADGKALGESGGFQSVSGLKFTLDTSIPSSVVLDDNGSFVTVSGARRVQDVQVLKDGAWVAIDPAATYTLASHNYMIKDGGDGFNMFQGDELLIDAGTLDYQVLLTYITDTLGGKLADKYSAPEGRIIIK